MAKCIVFYYSMFFHILSAEFSRIKRRLPQSSLTAVCSRRLHITSAAYNGDLASATAPCCHSYSRICLLDGSTLFTEDDFRKSLTGLLLLCVSVHRNSDCLTCMRQCPSEQRLSHL